MHRHPPAPVQSLCDSADSRCFALLVCAEHSKCKDCSKLGLSVTHAAKLAHGEMTNAESLIIVSPPYSMGLNARRRGKVMTVSLDQMHAAEQGNHCQHTPAVLAASPFDAPVKLQSSHTVPPPATSLQHPNSRSQQPAGAAWDCAGTLSGLWRWCW